MQKLTFIVFISHDLHPSIFVTNGQSRCISMNIPMFTMVPMQSYHLSWLTNIGQALNIQFCLQKNPNLLKSLEIQFRELRNICGTYHETSHGIVNKISNKKWMKFKNEWNPKMNEIQKWMKFKNEWSSKMNEIQKWMYSKMNDIQF